MWIGPRNCPTCEIPAWKVVLLTGAIPLIPPVPGLEGHAITMWSVSDAQDLQRAIERQFELGAVMPDREGRARALSFTVVGGSATGVEIVGTIAGVLPKMIRGAGYDLGEEADTADARDAPGVTGAPAPSGLMAYWSARRIHVGFH